MTFLGKIFSVLIFVLSLAFLMVSLMVTATHKNWRDVAINPETGLKQQVVGAKESIGQLQESLQRLQTDLSRERAARRSALATLNTQKDQLDAALQSNESRIQGLVAENTVLTQQNKTSTDELKRLNEENTELRTLIKKEREDRDNLFLTVAKVTDELNARRGELLEMTERNETLVTQNTRYKEVLQAKDINPEDPIDGAPPRVNGVVLEVEPASRLVLVSIGFDQGFEERASARHFSGTKLRG